MGQYFLIANKCRKEFLDPFVIPASEKFPKILSSHFIQSALTLLVCGSSNRKYVDLKKSAFYTSKYLGAWYGQKVDILGDNDEEDESKIVRNNYKNISIEVIAMLIE